MRRIVILGVLTALLAAACGGGDDSVEASTTTTIEGTDEVTDTAAVPVRPTEFVVTENDNGAVLPVQPGDVITVRLPVEDPANPLWILATEPDPAIVQIADSLLWIPSEPGGELTHFEFVFWVTGSGGTGMTFSLGPLSPTSPTVGFTIESVSG